MLTFAEYRKKVVVEAAPVKAEEAHPAAPATTPDHLASDMERTIDQFVGTLKQQLTNPMTGPDAQRGVWDRMKNWWSNMWHGRYNQQNPYFWQNKLGDDLGRTSESTQPLPLEHYMVLHEQANLLELALAPGAEKLQVIKIVDQWARQFKSAVMNLVSRHHTPVEVPDLTGEEPAPAPAPVSEKKPVPVKPDELEEEKPEEKDEPAVDPKKDPLVFDDHEESRTKLMDELKALKGKLNPAVYEKLKHHLETGDEHHLSQVAAFLSKRTAPMKDPADTPTPPEELPKTEPAPPERVDPADDASPPKPDKRQWKELSPFERQQWDDAGGGNAGDASFNARHHHDIKTLPWILRIGDPRLTHIESIQGGGLYRKLVRQKRIELPAHPIKSKIQLEKAIEEAKRLHGDERSSVSVDRKKRHETRKLRNDIKSRLDPADTEGAPVLKPDPADTGGAPDTDEPEPVPAARTAKLPEPSAVDPPVDPPVVDGEKKKKRVRPPRTKPAGEKTAVVDAVDPAPLKADLESIKGDIDDDLYLRLKSWIERGEKGEPEYLESVRDKLKVMKAAIEKNDDNSHGLDAIETTIRDRTAFLVCNFKNRINENNKDVSIHGKKKRHISIRG